MAWLGKVTDFSGTDCSEKKGYTWEKESGGQHLKASRHVATRRNTARTSDSPLTGEWGQRKTGTLAVRKGRWETGNWKEKKKQGWESTARDIQRTRRRGEGENISQDSNTAQRTADHHRRQIGSEAEKEKEKKRKRKDCKRKVDGENRHLHYSKWGQNNKEERK